MPGRELIVIGASAGGVQALTELLRGLPQDLPAAVFVVVHTSPTSPGILPQILDRAGPLPAAHPADGESVRAGRVYVAPPDHHMLLKHAPAQSRNGNGSGKATPPATVRIVRGPKENGFRPAVDPLFRTAARVGGPRTIGVVLSGGLDDGTEGLALIKSCGGLAVAQDPTEAHFPSMPQSAITYVECDHVLPVANIAKLLTQMAREPLPEGANAMPADDAHQPDVAEVGDTSLASGDLPAPPSGFTCPECGGALWELRSGRMLKFRCHVGHSYGADGLVAEQTRDLEASLWTALRALEESAALRRRMARRARRGTWPAIAEDYERQAKDAEARAALIRRTLMAEEPATETIRASPSPTPRWDGRLYGPNGKGSPGKRAGAKGRRTNPGGGADGKGRDTSRRKNASGAARPSGKASKTAGPAGRRPQDADGKRRNPK